AGASVADLADAEVAPLLARASARSATRAMRLAKRALDALPRAMSRRIVLSRAARVFAMGTGGTPVSAFQF
ncbi:MAG: hypothetical protein KBD01_20130, partial [Acidobacteria bacterium]|nr:hypothetical protein [Acidobacteriota bacterium]